MDMICEIPGYEVAGFVENMDRTICDKPLEGHRVYWVDDVPRLAATHLAICALSTTQRRSYIEQVRAMGLRFATLVHPTARVSKRAKLGDGCFVSAMAAIATDTVLGRNVYVNRGALIGHHTTIGDYCTIQPGANIAGANTIGQQTYVGMGAVVLDRHAIGEGSVIASGAVVTADVPARVCVMGVPAKVTRTEIEPK
jgi:sugar O-acyltransferase (sialic acid O-acetyltransferase NeuD family)